MFVAIFVIVAMFVGALFSAQASMFQHVFGAGTAGVNVSACFDSTAGEIIKEALRPG